EHHRDHPVHREELGVQLAQVVVTHQPVPQVRVRSLDANLGPLPALEKWLPGYATCRALCEGRNSTPPRTTAFLPTFFITFFSYAHHRLAPQSVRRYLDSAPSRTAPVSRDERISGRKLFTAIYNIWPRSAPPQVHAKQQNSMLSPIF